MDKTDFMTRLALRCRRTSLLFWEVKKTCSFILIFYKCLLNSRRYVFQGTSLGVQWLTLFTPNSGTWFQSLARETATKNPTSHNKDQRFQVLQLNLSAANQINIYIFLKKLFFKMKIEKKLEKCSFGYLSEYEGFIKHCSF